MHKWLASRGDYSLRFGKPFLVLADLADLNELRRPIQLTNQQIGGTPVRSATELCRVLSIYTGYSLIGFQLEPGPLHGFVNCALLSTGAIALMWHCDKPVLISGTRNPELTCFSAVISIKPTADETEAWFWKNKSLPGNLIGGFGLSETQCHFELSADRLHLALFVPKAKLMDVLDDPSNRAVYEYMSATNMAQFMDVNYNRFVNYVTAANWIPHLLPEACPVTALLDQMNDASFACGLPSRQLLPSTEQLLVCTPEIMEQLSELNVAKLAKLTNLGRTQLNAACQEAYRRSPSEFLRLLKLEESMMLLRSPASRDLLGLKNIADVHAHIGISSSSTFRKQFFDLYQAKPSEWWVS